MACEKAAQAKAQTFREHKQLLMDLQFIPDDKLDWTPMGKAKTPEAIAVECAGAYRWMAAMLRNDEGANQLWGDIAELRPGTREGIVKLLEEGWEDLAGALDSLEEAQLAEKRQVFWGEETVGNLLVMAQWHSTYHSGQLNYIQTMLGDMEMHMAMD